VHAARAQTCIDVLVLSLCGTGPAFAFGQFKHVWVYLLSTMAGGACAGLTYDKLFLEEIQVATTASQNILLHVHLKYFCGWCRIVAA